MKAFDSVNRDRLLAELMNLNITGPLLAVIADMLRYNTLYVSDSLLLSQPVMQNVGVPQGDTLSPYLFILLTADLINQVKNRFAGVDLLMYADDMVLFSVDRNLLQEALEFVSVYSVQFGLRINKEKTKAMKFRRCGRVARGDTLHLEGEPVEFVRSYTYLGVTLPTNGRSFTQHIATRAQKAIICATQEILNPSSLSIATALKLFYLKVAPVASYGIVTVWQHLTYANLCILDRVKTTFLKRVLGVSKSSRNRLVYVLVGCETFIENLRSMFHLPDTAAYNMFTVRANEKRASIVSDFYHTPAMTQVDWRGPFQKRRHIFTRHSMHGFHHVQ